VPLNRTSVINCGFNGAQCMACASGELCTNGTCMTTGAVRQVGSACVSDTECISGLGTLAICKQVTTSGNGAYTGGYCTLRCGTAAGQCPMGSTCVGLLPAYGEADTICWDNCSSTDRCRTPGYACYGVGTTSACWLDPMPPLDAGTPADKVGNPCTSAANCVNPPDNGGVCLTSEFSLSWPGGYCSKSGCITNPECSVDGGALCIAFDSTSPNACVRRCADSSDAGQSNCRPGYTCNPYITRFPDGGQQTSTDGFCSP
jgi:hypothetical protein